MTTETIAALGTAFAAVALAIGTIIVNFQKAKGDREAAVEKAKAEREAAAEKAEHEAETRKDAYRDAFITTLQVERAKLVDESEKTRAAHGSCLELVGELTGRVESLEVQGQRTEIKLADCLQAHQLAANDARSLREKVAVLEKRTSDPKQPVTVTDGARRYR